LLRLGFAYLLQLKLESVAQLSQLRFDASQRRIGDSGEKILERIVGRREQAKHRIEEDAQTICPDELLRQFSSILIDIRRCGLVTSRLIAERRVGLGRNLEFVEIDRR